MKPARFLALAVATVAATLLPAMAQQGGSRTPKQTPAQVLEAAKAKSKEMDELRSALRSPDASLRTSAFNAMIASDDPTMTEVAMNEAIASDDTNLRALALRASGRTLRNIILVPSGLPEGRVWANYDRYASQLSFRTDRFYYIEDGTFRMCDTCNAKVSISGLSLTFSNSPCRGVLTNIPGTWEMEGEVSCENSTQDRWMRGTFRMKMR